MHTMKKSAISAAKAIMYLLLLAGTAMGAMQFVFPALGLQMGKLNTPSGLLAASVLNFLAMSVPAFVMSAAIERKSPARMGLQIEGSMRDFLTGSFTGAFVFAFALSGAFFAGFARWNPIWAEVSMSSIMIGAAALTLAAAGEEIMMRGYILQELMSKFSIMTSVIVSSLLFSALHAGALIHSPMAILGALNIFAAGVMLSLAYLATRSLWLPIGMHLGWNFIQGPVLGINVSGNEMDSGWHPITLTGPEMMTGGNFGFEASLIGLAGPLMGILLILMFARGATPNHTTESE